MSERRRWKDVRELARLVADRSELIGNDGVLSNQDGRRLEDLVRTIVSLFNGVVCLAVASVLISALAVICSCGGRFCYRR